MTRALWPRRASLLLLVLAACRSNVPERRTAVPAWLLERARVEDALLAHSSVPHDFRFTDRRAASGITFENRIVDDAGKAYKKVHYDHGSGLCAADVDGDGLPDLYFMTQLGTNELWKNLGGGKFANITDQAGLGMPDAIAVACAFADIDNDGLPDLFVTTVRHGNRLFKNLGGGKFTDITAHAGVGYVGHSSGAVFFDYDGDGLLDLFVTNVGVYTTNERGPGGYYVGLSDAFHGHTHPDRAEPSILYKNLGGGRFKDVTKAVGLVDLSWSGDATVIDANDDGWPDLYVLDMQGENHLWLNEAGKRFRDATRDYFPKTPWGAMGVKAFDFDGDGRVDLFVTDMHSDMWVNVPPGDWAAEARKADTAPAPPDFFPDGKSRFIFGNALFANRGSGRFEEVSDPVGVETYWPWGPTVDDLNADGWDDIFVTAGMNFPHRYGVNSVLLNDAGRRFLPAEFSLGVEPRADGEEQVWFRLDCRGADREQLFCSVCAKSGSATVGCRWDPGGRQLTMMASRGTRAAVALDLDDDGDLDVVTNEFNAPPQVLVSDLAQRHHIHFLKIRLRGTRSNRQGLGAEVTVVLPDGHRILKVMDGKSGYLSQSDLPLYFGLGDADHAAALEVRWPSGQRQTVAGPISSGQTREVVEP
jgi:enediyne biosynthesis protein E4